MPSAVVVRFRPSQYVAPSRTHLDLSADQQTILQTLGTSPRPLSLLSLHELKQHLQDVPEWRVKEDLQMLKKSGLVGTSGHARTARWFLTPNSKEGQE